MRATGCLGADTLVEILEGRADDVTYDRALAHASTCESCRGLLSSLARNETGEAPTSRQIGESQPPTLVEGLKPARPSGLDLGAHVDRYEIIRMIGAGGMGYVYAARDPELDRLVALKLLRPDLGGGEAQLRLHERLRREAQAMAQLAHPNVVAVHDVGAYEDRVFVAMEYIEGETLAQWIEGKTSRQILDAYIAAGRGLAAAHAAGLVHRDFKPENALVGSDGRVRVGDFGLARTLDKRVVSKSPARRPDDNLELTRTGVAMGTPLYMAPEQFLGDTADKRSDQFSFCVALYGALYGTRPFAGDTFEDLAETVLSGTITEPIKRVRVPRRARAAIRRGLSLEAGDRWPSMDALLDELSAKPVRWPWLAVPAVGVAAAATIVIASLGSDASPCDRDRFGGMWDAAKKAEIRAALVATKLPYAAATATAVERAGDRFTTAWTQMRVGSCRAREDGMLKPDTYALQATCLALRKRDLESVVAALVAVTPELAPRAATAFDGLVPIEICEDRAMLQLLLGPNDPSVRVAINRVIGGLHTVRAALALADPKAMPRVTELVATARTIDQPAVRAEVLDVAGRYAATIGDLAHARDWLTAAIADAELGRHDLAAASASIALVDVNRALGPDFGTLRDLHVSTAETVHRVKQRRELGIANDIAIAGVDVEIGRADEASADLAAAAQLADTIYSADDLRRVAPHRALADALLAARHPAAARVELVAIDKQLRSLLGDDHPAVASTLVALGDVEAVADPVLGDADYARAQTVATTSGDRTVLAEVIEHRAALARKRGDLAAAGTLYAHAMELDGSTTTPAAIRRTLAAADLALARRDPAAAKALYVHARAAMTAAWPADAPALVDLAAKIDALH